MRLISLALAAAICAFTLLLPTSAVAQYEAYICPGGPGPGEVQVGSQNGTPLCRSTGGGQSAPAPTYTYGSIAWHIDAGDVWMAGTYDGPNGAEREALAACNADMGGGCSSIGEWHNSVMAIVRSADGTIHSGWGRDSGSAKRQAQSNCRANLGDRQILPCEAVGMFSSGKRRHKPDLRTARRIYGAAAWVVGEGYDSRMWVTTGKRTAQEAIDTAIAACSTANPGRTCKHLSIIGNAFIQTYLQRQADGSLSSDSVAEELSPKRAVEAVTARCKKARLQCTLQVAYDSRLQAEFVHNFKTGTRE